MQQSHVKLKKKKTTLRKCTGRLFGAVSLNPESKRFFRECGILRRKASESFTIGTMCVAHNES